MDEHVQKVTVDDLEFDVRVSGPERAPTVLLLHGFPTTGACFDEVVPRLHDSGLRTVVPDQRGYSPGARPTAVEAYRIDLLVSDAVGILDAVGAGYAHVVGHDWGGLVAWHLAARHSDRVTGLVAASTGHPSAFASVAGDPDQRKRSAYIPKLIAPEAEDTLLADDAARLRALVPDDSVLPLTDRPALTGALNWYRANLTADRIKTAMSCPPVEVPTTMIWSENDTALGRDQAERSGRFVFSDFRFCALPGVDHWIPQRAPQALASEIALRSATF
ncbi:alpha/beta fold hydrolase [Williamsia sterculiae]|uniref:Pimeloyl-ACP methyl ester carboxylesterase n=1 Tax=Williamsia sterculiae TaxID=1344003 RepID=A0A1N7GEK2_9NOCA|nr:alpha/beta hydrolase [Williamsia sterculiae]SIS10906.1 Pimeloyl-ACP methyl ester carboxylesterase [Williamsia sterculiae]